MCLVLHILLLHNSLVLRTFEAMSNDKNNTNTSTTTVVIIEDNSVYIKKGKQSEPIQPKTKE